MASAGPCKSFTTRSWWTTTIVPHHSVFTGRLPFLPPNQQHKEQTCKHDTPFSLLGLLFQSYFYLRFGWAGLGPTKDNLPNNWSRFFTSRMVFPVTQATASEHWRELKTLTPTSHNQPLASSFQMTPDGMNAKTFTLIGSQPTVANTWS